MKYRLQNIIFNYKTDVLENLEYSGFRLFYILKSFYFKKKKSSFNQNFNFFHFYNLKNNFIFFFIFNNRFSVFSVIINFFLFMKIAFKSNFQRYLTILKRTFGEGFIYIRGLLVIFLIDASVTDDEPL